MTSNPPCVSVCVLLYTTVVLNYTNVLTLQRLILFDAVCVCL